MKRTPLTRRTPLRAETPLQRHTPLRTHRPLERRVVAVVGEPEQARAARARRRRTGPDRAVCLLVDARSGRVCEWPGCDHPQTDRHHRLNRKMGGRHGEARERVNGAAWLLGVCRRHHEYVTSPHGQARRTALAMGWVLLEHQDAEQVPVLTRHDIRPVLLTSDGTWRRINEGGE